MVRLLFNNKTEEWDSLDQYHPKEYTGCEKEIKIDGFRKKYLDQIKGDLKNDLDHVEIICGDVGTGKSTLGRLDCRYVSDEKFDPRTHVIRDERDIKRVIQGAKKGEAILIDEGSMIFSATETMTKKQKYAQLILDVVRQKNLLIVVCAPAIHRLSATLVIDRAKTASRTYIHSKNLKRGYFAFYGKSRKDMLYTLAKKNHGKVEGLKAKYHGEFPEEKTYEEEYKRVKDETLNIALDKLKFPGEDDEPEVIKHSIKQGIVKEYQIELVKNNMGMPLQQLVDVLGVSIKTVGRLRSQVRGLMSDAN